MQRATWAVSQDQVFGFLRAWWFCLCQVFRVWRWSTFVPLSLLDRVHPGDTMEHLSAGYATSSGRGVSNFSFYSLFFLSYSCHSHGWVDWLSVWALYVYRCHDVLLQSGGIAEQWLPEKCGVMLELLWLINYAVSSQHFIHFSLRTATARMIVP